MKPSFTFQCKPATLYFLFLFLCLFHTHTESFSQQLRAAYPVQVTAFLPAPYSLNLADYCSGIKPKLLVTLLNRDLMEPNLQVRLHLSISAGNGIRIQTIDYNAYPGISLSPGVPYQLTLDDLCPYFQAENLNIQGALPGGRLPEGMIEICVSAVEVHTSRPVSQSGCARAWITLNRPPLLNLPANGVSIPFRDPMNILFQWTPRHQGLSNVEYEFSLREIMDTGVAVEGAFDYSPEVWSTVVRSTSLAYTAMQPPLLEGKRYGWQVRAVVRDGFQEQSLFENRGYSEIHAFTLSPGCNPPTGVSHHQETGHLVVEWTPPSGSLQSVVAYRSSTSGADWLVVKGNEGRANIFDMVFDHVYEYKVGTVCVDGSIVYGEIHTASLKDWRKDIKANCGVLPVIDLGNKAPLPVLRPGDMIMAGDFPVTVSRCEGSGGNFTGLGWTRLPLMASVKIAVQFTGIRVNTDYRMIGGYVETSYDKNESQVADGDRLWHGGDQTGQTITGAVESNVKANFSIPEGAVVTYDEGTGKLIVSDKEGKELGKITVPEKDKAIFTSGEPYTYTIQDKDDKIHTVTGDGKGNTTVAQAGSQGPALTAGSFSETAIADKKAIVEFSQGKDASYAFDTWKDYYKTVSLIANKQKYEFLGSYAVPCKLIPPGKTDKVSVSISIIDKKINADSILFRTKGGYQATLVNGELTLTGGKANDAQDLYALYPDGKGKYLTLGKLKVLSYPEPTFNVVLVPVRDGNTGQTYSTDPTAVERALHEAYGPLGISWNVTLDEPFDYPTTDLNSEGSDLFSRYTDEMKALNSAYKTAKGSLDSKTVYIFILRSGDIKGADLSGDMPRGKQFGYVFTEGGSLPRTIAHELGHGKFKLRHTFDGEYGGTAKATQGKTDNLMDYGQGTRLAKWQWDEVFDPAILVNPFESDEEGMAVNEADPVEALMLKAQQLTAEFGNVYAVIHGFSPKDNKDNKKSFEKKFDVINTDGAQPILITGFYSDKEKVYTNVLFFKFSGGNSLLEKTSFDYDLRKELSLHLKISSDVPYLAVVMPEDVKGRDCTPFIGKLDGVAIAAIHTGEYDSYNKGMLEAAEDCTKEKSLLIFANGYRLASLDDVPKTEYPNTTNNTQPMDIYNYWVGVDAKFKELLAPRNVAYVDGHHSITTSNHLTMARFVASIASSKLAANFIVGQSCYHNPACVDLSTTPNTAGFNERRQNGVAVGTQIVDKIRKGEYQMRIDNEGKVIDKVDIVCHSMGFAYALGIIDVLKQSNISLGRFYIIAPENACSGTINLEDFEDVWQYGTDEETLREQPWLQDGVAPQCKVEGLEDIQGRSGRAFIPPSVSQGFVESHSIANYQWIFNLDSNQDGYVKPKK